MSTEQTAEIARAYFRAWTTADREGVANALAEDFVFDSAMVTLNGREAVLETQAWPKGATTTLVADAYQDDHGFQMYDAVNGGNTVRVVERLEVENGRLVRSTVVVDPAAFRAFLGM
ncbi:MAG: nuclear transport factor 2 family protein [Actinophytocola sp.]|uniref:nuclear transport factor 2 family protein n=1 Tax=Actinophytocola sp. TaxID=1872138 RepID=UPI003D6C4620